MRSFPVTAWSGRSVDRATAPAERRYQRAPPPNELWCADFKGEFKLGNGRYCYPLTVTDHWAQGVRSLTL
jgi:transposase InsO family protein